MRDLNQSTISIKLELSSHAGHCKTTDFYLQSDLSLEVKNDGDYQVSAAASTACYASARHTLYITIHIIIAKAWS